MTTKQRQSQKQVVQIFLTEEQKKKKKKKKKKKSAKSRSKTKIGQIQPYQIPLAYPAYPQVIPKYEADKSTQIANALRNYMTTTTEQLKGVRNNLNAIRIEQQTAGRRRVAFPVEPYSGASQSDFREDIETDIDDARRTEEEDIRSATDASTAISEGEEIMRRARRTTTLSETEADTDAEETKSELPSPLLPPRGRRPRVSNPNKNKAELIKELKQQGVKVPSSLNAAQVRKIAQQSGISLLR
jgi:hypothetical protein